MRICKGDMMKKMMIAGGLGGFGLGTLCGLSTQGSAWPGILLRASIAALGTGWLFRWWGGVFARCLAQAHAEARAKLSAERSATPAPPKPGALVLPVAR
jgi:hypothetical protein